MDTRLDAGLTPIAWRRLLQGSLGIPLMLLALLGMMVLPIPALLLDLFFTFNITLSIAVLLVCLYALKPLDFAVFPTVLLITTLFRLALNVASTRAVLLHGHEGSDAAGKVIEAFGEVVIGGNYAVGLVVFAILMIINFAVVTKGAGRISEVSARFTLDAMPGKQMAIDADLNAGMLTQEQAQQRRREVAQEADFYGAMDGASKFIRGDAIAGLMILVINIFGGLGIGMLQHDLSFGEAMSRYSLLTIGDGLAAQLPSLLLSIAAAIMVTRVESTHDMSAQIVAQMFGSPRVLMVTAGVMGVIGAIPGMPHLVFGGLAAATGGIGYWLEQKKRRAIELPEVNEATVAAPASEVRELGWDDVAPVDVTGLEVGYRLIPLVDSTQGGELLARIKGIRKKLSQDLGFLIPSVHIRDNLELPPNHYRIILMGVAVGEGRIEMGKELAINPGRVFGTLPGVETQDPAFGLPAIWIDSGQRERAQSLGYTVVDSSTVVATHLNQILLEHAVDLLGHEEVQKLLDLLVKSSPKLAEELIPNRISLSLLLKILQNLLRERVSIRDLRTIAEAITSVMPPSQDPAVLTAAVRIALSRMIVQGLVANSNEIPVITLEPQLEQILLTSYKQARDAGTPPEEGMVIEPSLAERMQRMLKEAVTRQEMAGQSAVLLVAAPLRPVLARFARYGGLSLQVLSYQEIPENKQITVVATIGRH